MLSFVHFLLLGFVMMVIFGAMAQLVPVVLEVGHFAVELYYIIYPLLFVGTLMMSTGFAFLPQMLPYGGVVVLIALLVFIFETFMTIKKVEKFNMVITSVAIANSFLFLGLIFGIIMALGYAGVIDVDISELLRAHIYLVFVGYVGVTIMGMSLILLPMFWLSHHFSWRSVTIALYLISFGVLSVVISSLTSSNFFEYIGYVLSITALFFYFHQIYVIYKSRARVENDIYLKSMLFAFTSFFIALVLGVVYLFLGSNTLLLTIGFVSVFGFVNYMIIGHLYKIIPFLVWFERFSPLVGKEKVPMLADMLPVKSANMQFLFTTLGISVATFGLLVADNTFFKMGVSSLIVGAIFTFKDALYMIKFK